jgi:hypothetical protein
MEPPGSRPRRFLKIITIMANFSWPRAKAQDHARQAAKREREESFLLTTSRFGQNHSLSAAHYTEIATLTRRINNGRQIIKALPLGDPRYQPFRNLLLRLINERKALRQPDSR